MTRVLHVAASPGERRFALADGDRLLHYEVARPNQADRVEELCRAGVESLAPAQNGAFLRLPGNTPGFLPSNAVPKGLVLVAGQALCVRITRAAMGGKGLRATARDVAQSAGEAPMLLAAAPDPEARLLRDLAPDRVVRAVDFPPGIADAVAALIEPEVALEGGGRLRVWPTPALTAIDVDSGAGTAAEANTRALAAVAEAIVLRNLSGVILVDFAALATRTQKAAMATRLRAALAADPLRADVTGHSPAGLAEVVRRKIRPPLHETVGTTGPAWAPSAETIGLTALRQALTQALATPALRPALRAHPRVVAALRATPNALAEFAAKAGAPLVLREDATLPRATTVTEDARHG